MRLEYVINQLEKEYSIQLISTRNKLEYTQNPEQSYHRNIGY